MWTRLKRRYQGEYEPPKNDPGSGLVFLNHRRRPPLARAISVVVEFYLKHWQWCVGTAFAAVAITVQLTRTH
jgi:hypothetical protein